MKTKFALKLSIVFMLFAATGQVAFAQGTAFTYQGRLNDGSNPATGIYDLRFTIYDSTNLPGVVIAGPLTNSATGVSNGLFTVTLDFSAGVFTGPDRWLDIAVRTNGGTTFTIVNPRQKLTATPYAIMSALAAGLPGLLVQQNTNGAPNLIGGSSANFVAGGVVGATIGGGGATNYYGILSYSNTVTGDFGTVSGGASNTSSYYYATVGGGYANCAASVESTVGGGGFNIANGAGATVSGGGHNIASYDDATVSGGYQNIASAGNATVAGGLQNTSSNYYATVSGGANNSSGGVYATVPGGDGNSAAGNYSFAAGFRAKANHEGSFVWADFESADFASTAANQFSVRAAGGVRLFSDVQIGAGSSDYHYLLLGGGNSTGFLYGSYQRWGDGIHLGYNYYADSIGLSHIINGGGGTSRITVGYGSIVLATGDVGVQPTFENVQINTTTTTVNGTFDNNSDRNAKQNFAPVSPADILEKVARLPLSEWSYKVDPYTRHVGPMAQDFHSLFNIGTDDKHIAPIDEGGVALVAIQGLNEKVVVGSQKSERQIEELKVENAVLKQQNESLEKRLENLEQMVKSLVAKD